MKESRLMGKASSQWDFGELFDENEFKKTYTVSELTGAIRKTLEKGFGRIRVTGEISNFRAQSSGHCYFGLKDQGAQLSCVLFRGERVSHRKELDNGVKVVVEGDLTVYEARGQYQLIVRALKLQGIGALQAAFDRLKKKLDGEGLFDSERKRLIPTYCFRLGLVTSASAAALRDVLHVVRRRHPAMQLVLSAARVQGQGAANEIAAGIAHLNRYAASVDPAERLQAILVTRGGGSLEDLWAFNEEAVARAVADSELPVISAIGHEIDFTICDFVADLRAPTPSAAAELVTEGVFSSREFVQDSLSQLRSLMQRELGHRGAILEQWDRRLSVSHPRRSLDLLQQRLDDCENILGRQAMDRCAREALRIEQLGTKLLGHRPRRVLDRERERLDGLHELVATRGEGFRQRWRGELDHLGKMLHLLSPLNVLERGYSITRVTDSGDIVDTVDGIRVGDSVTTLVKDGELVSQVTLADKNENES